MTLNRWKSMGGGIQHYQEKEKNNLRLLFFSAADSFIHTLIVTLHFKDSFA